MTDHVFRSTSSSNNSNPFLFFLVVVVVVVVVVVMLRTDIIVVVLPLTYASDDATVFQSLDTTLEYVLIFLEGDHAKSHAISGAMRSTIVTRVP